MDINIYDTLLMDGEFLTNDEKELWILYMKVMSTVGLGDVAEWMKLDLSMPQMKILMLLNNKGPLKVSDIARHLSASFPNTTGLLDRLEHADFIERIPDSSDRRSVMVHLTDNAKEIFRSIYKKGHKKLKRSLQIMTSEEKEVVKAGLELLAHALKTSAE